MCGAVQTLANLKCTYPIAYSSNACMHCKHLLKWQLESSIFHHKATYTSPCGWIAALAFPIGLDNTGTPAGLQIAAPPGNDGLMLSLGLAMERIFGPMPPPPTTAACSGCAANVAYVQVGSKCMHVMHIHSVKCPPWSAGHT